MSGCVTLMVFSRSCNAKVAPDDASNTGGVHEYVCAFDVEVNGLYDRMKLGRTVGNVGKHKNTLVGLERFSVVLARQETFQTVTHHEGIHQAGCITIFTPSQYRHDIWVVNLQESLNFCLHVHQCHSRF